MPKLIIVTVNWFNSDLILHMLNNLHAKAAHSEDLAALVIDNTNGRDKSLKNIKNCCIPYAILPIDSNRRKGSIGHAWALDHAMKYLDSEYSLIVDPDIYVFLNKWDQFCVAEMKRVGAIAIGAPYPIWKVGKYHDFPSPPFCFFHTASLKKMKNGWEPYGPNFIYDTFTFFFRQIGRIGILVNRKRFEKYLLIRKYAKFSENLFGVFSQDTGWKLAEEVRNKNIKTIVFDSVLPQDNIFISKKPNYAYQSLIREYEVFSYKNKIILTHKYGTAGPLWRTKSGANIKHWIMCIHRIEST